MLVNLSAFASWNLYQSEFRSFWIQPPTGTIDNFGSAQEPAKNDKKVSLPSLPPKETNFKNQRQENIFWNLIREYKERQFDRLYILNSEFRKLVDDFAFPVSRNLINSVRIDALSQMLKQCNKNMNLLSDPVRHILKQTEWLDVNDRQFLKDEDLSQPFWDQARRQLSQGLFDLIAELIKTGKLRTPKNPGDFPESRSNAVPV